MRLYQLMLLPVLALGCNADSTAPRPIQLQPRVSANAVPADLPNLVRFQNGWAFGIADVTTGLLAIAGLPDNPRNNVVCGGTDESPLALATHQWEGFLGDVIKSRAMATDVNIDVYDLATFINACTSDPIAHGKGQLSGNSNDLFGTSTRTSNAQFRMEGTVVLVGGGTAHLTAHSLFQFVPPDTFIQVVSDVTLSGQ